MVSKILSSGLNFSSTIAFLQLRHHLEHLVSKLRIRPHQKCHPITAYAGHVFFPP